MKSILIVFAKTPILGNVKSRLADKLGDIKTLWVYKQLLKKTKIAIQSIQQNVVVYYLGDRTDFFDQLFLNCEKHPQEGIDLGERMANAISTEFEKGFNQIIIIGTDMWDLNQENIKKAFKDLNNSDIVIGPASDGGYYLLGIKKMIPDIFQNKKWGSQTVLKETLKDLKNYKVSFLKEKNDIDLLEDLKKHPNLLNKLKHHFNEK